MYYTYVLRSKVDGNLYIGFAHDLQRRLEEHTHGEVAATHSRLPVELVYYEACLKKDRALAREKYFKTGYGRRFLSERL